MGNLVLLLLGVDYLRKRALGWPSPAGCSWLPARWCSSTRWTGCCISLDGFAALIVIEGLATLAIAKSGVGGQRVLRYVKGLFVLTAGVVLAGDQHGHFVLSMIFGLLFLVDGLMQCIAAWCYARWRYVRLGRGRDPAGHLLLSALSHALRAPCRIAPAWPRAASARWGQSRAGRQRTAGLHADRVRWPGADCVRRPAAGIGAYRDVWTPSERYIAAVDVNGVISTGHAALESPEGVYVSLYPAQEIDRSPEQFGALLRTAENDVPGVFQPDYATEAQAWCPSTTQVRIRNYDAAKLQAFWDVTGRMPPTT